MKYYGIDLFFSGFCNFNCKYCVISSHPKEMADYNIQLRNSLADGSFANNVIQTLGYLKEDIKDISFWGMEPTINADLFKNIFIPLFDFYTNVETSMFSTNGSLGKDAILQILYCMKDYCEKNRRKISLTVQFSLDGPKWINDFSRREGATDCTINTMKQILSTNLTSDYLDIIFTNKATLDDIFIKKMNQYPELIYNYFEFFNNIFSDFKNVNINKNIYFGKPAKPTFVLPGQHTQQDGKELAKFIKNLKKVDVKNLQYYNHPLIEQPMRFINGNIFRDNIFYQLKQNYCCAGYGTICIDKDGVRYDCHTLYEKTVINQIDDFSKDYINLDKNNFKKQELMFENQRLLRNFSDSHFHITEPIIISLANSGQIDKIYKENQQARRILFLLALNSLCHEICALETGNIYVMNTSILKYLGNGAAQQLMDYYSYEWSNI